jgi:demethylmenaquinone methyltransferase / 2-methoxy-6-polyprenyl-1,4-benzoquinol methylase
MTKPPVQQVAGRKEQVESMFDSIAGRYDFLNHFLSMGIDRSWRRKLVRLMAKEKPGHILDLATGTGDLAIEAMKANPQQITGTDISIEMLAVGKEKIKKLGLENRISLLQADSENLPFAKDTFDAAMVAFGVRNYENLPKGLAEMNRVLKPGAKAFILEFATPASFPVKQLFAFYFRYILPVIGKLVSKHRSAYTYLPESVQAFPQGQQFLSLMKDAGFKEPECRKLTFGITILYMGNK